MGAALDLDEECADRVDRLVECPREVVPLVAESSQLRKGRKGPARASCLTMDGKRSPCGPGLPWREVQLRVGTQVRRINILRGLVRVQDGPSASHRTPTRNPSSSWTITSARVFGPRANAPVPLPDRIRHSLPTIRG